MRGLAALGFAGANVTTPHKLAVTAFCDTDVPSVNTLVVRDGGVEGLSTDTAILSGLSFQRPAVLGDGGTATAFVAALPHARQFSRRGAWPPDVADADLVVNATSERDAVVVELHAGQTLVDLPYPETATAAAARRAGARVVPGLEVLLAQGAASFELWTGLAAPVDVMRDAIGLDDVTLELTTAGESHGPALVGIVTGLPAGLRLDRDAIDLDLARRREGYGRSPRQQLEADEVDVLAGLRHGVTLGTPLALVIRNRDHANWEWGMSPWPPTVRRAGRGRRPSRCPGRVTPTSPALSSSATTTSAMRSSERARGRPPCTSLPARSRRRCSRRSA